MKTINEPFPKLPELKQSVDTKRLQGLLFLQTVAGARNVSAVDRLEALHNDIGTLILGEEPTQSKGLL
jgi:hypothetical protein